LSSSPGPRTASRWCRLSSEIARVAAVICRSGRSTLPAISQPSATDATAMTVSAMADTTSRWFSMAASWRTTWACT
jgi:hypothetical protein